MFSNLRFSFCPENANLCNSSWIHLNWFFVKLDFSESSQLPSCLLKMKYASHYINPSLKVILVSVQLLSHVQLFATPWTAAYQASLSFINSRSLLKLMSIYSVMPSNHFILCCPYLLLPSIFSSIRVFSNESVLTIVAKVLELQLQHQSFQWIFRTDFL